MQGDFANSIQLQKQSSKIEKKLTEYLDIKTRFTDLDSLYDLAKSLNDHDLLDDMTTDLSKLKTDIQSFSYKLLMYLIFVNFVQ